MLIVFFLFFVVVIVFVIAETFALFAADPVANFLLLAVALVFANSAFILPTVTPVLSFIGTAAFLTSLLPVISICVGWDLSEAE
ncbi:hypothetical protein NOR51B_479 [Luminiphilus syltensis NOR5-1B]|uniref:Uncharacterized protein n=1 Tax=Luminiphilus syltensis NOR5-1B TaxID=565045 RepID=B8KVN9_9GAMM|nr:hypothetical protein NOR51B_479 [Luminiphilus syltensis NOR5-1B]